MRLLLVALMIALLPLRGWAITAMAVDQEEASIATQNIATSAYETLATSVFYINISPVHTDCRTDIATHPTAQTDDLTTASHNCTSCDACGLCHLNAATRTPLTPENLGHPSTRPVALSQNFASVTPPPRLKPPIG